MNGDNQNQAGGREMTATSALQAALEYGGWNERQDANVSEDDIRAYFSPERFLEMFGSAGDCGGYSLDECADAVIQWQSEAE